MAAKKKLLTQHSTLKFLLILLFFDFSLFTFLPVPQAGDLFAQSVTWQKVLNNEVGWLNKIQQTTDGGYIAVGEGGTYNFGGTYLVKLDYLGNTSWTKIIDAGYDGNWVEQTADNGYIIGGTINGGAYLLKTDSFGNIQWERTYSNSGSQCYCVKQTADMGYILSIRTTSYICDVVMFLKTDSIGNEIWRKIYGNGDKDIAIHEIEIAANGYIAVGITDDWYMDPVDLYVLKLNTTGDTTWTKRYGGNIASVGYAVDKVGNEGFIIGGTSISFNPNHKLESYVCKIDTGGNLIWQRTYSNSGWDFCKSIRYKPNIGFVLAGGEDSLYNNNGKSKIRLIDLEGKLLRENSFTPETADSYMNSVEPTADGGFIAAGEADFPGAHPKMYIIKTDSLLQSTPIGLINISNTVPKDFNLSQNYPNPFNPATNIEFDIANRSNVKLIIYDVLGREMETLVNEYLNTGSYKIAWNGEKYSSGIYFYRLIAQNYTETRKMVLIK